MPTIYQFLRFFTKLGYWNRYKAVKNHFQRLKIGVLRYFCMKTRLELVFELSKNIYVRYLAKTVIF